MVEELFFFVKQIRRRCFQKKNKNNEEAHGRPLKLSGVRLLARCAEIFKLVWFYLSCRGGKKKRKKLLKADRLLIVINYFQDRFLLNVFQYVCLCSFGLG